MTWSPLRHSLNVNGPLKTVGAVFSGALSKSSAFEVAVRYLPNTCVGSGGIVFRSRIAGHETFVSRTVHFLALPLSMAMPEIDEAVAVHFPAPAGAQYSLK